MRTGDPGRSVAGRVLSLLEAFETCGSALTLTQLAEAAGLPPATAHRLVGELVEWGALTRDGQGRYHVGMRLWELSQSADRRLRDTARPFLQDLFSLTGETAHLAVRVGNDALYVDRVYGSRRVPRASRIGGRLPLHATAVGKVLLAGEEPWFRDAYLARALEAPTRRTHIDPAGLSSELGRITDAGHAMTAEEVRVGASSIAVPVVVDDVVVAAIGLVVGSHDSSRMSRHLPTLRGVAERVGTALSHLPAGYTRSTAHFR